MRGSFALVLGLLVTAVSHSVHGEAVRIGESDGALYDGIFDGYPGIALFDGTPDLTNNPPSVALKFGVLEMRTVAEFPLPAVAGKRLSGADRVVLHFNIDDVIPTFGPGAEFSGRAASTILVHPYCGDGATALDDSLQVGAAAFEVDTTPFGVITDETLARSGPLFFELDVTEAVVDLLAEGCAWLGFVFRTTTNNTATSIDDLGDGGSYGGTKGAGGASLPSLEWFFSAEAPPTLTTTVEPVASPTLSPTPTARSEGPSETPTTTPACAGDCNGDSAVTIDEVLVLVRIALGLGSPDSCVAGDLDRSADITVDEIIVAVTAALLGCQP